MSEPKPPQPPLPQQIPPPAPPPWAHDKGRGHGGDGSDPVDPPGGGSGIKPGGHEDAK